jgi:hypothetical protein
MLMSYSRYVLCSSNEDAVAGSYRYDDKIWGDGTAVFKIEVDFKIVFN